MTRRKSLIFWAILFTIIVFLTTFSSFIAPFEPNEMNLEHVYATPGDGYLLGTDHLGRDVFSRLIEGGKVTLTVGIVSVIISLLIGVVYGGISGYFGGLVDSIMMRLLESLLTIPNLVIILAFQAVIQGSVWSLTLIIGVTSWLTTARIVRSEFIKLKKTEFVEMAKMFGTPLWKIITGHLLRNSFSAIFIVTLFNFAGAVFIEASLSFLGIGVSPAIPSWGNMLYYAQNDILIGAWWIGLFPGIMIFLTVLSINYIGESLKVENGGNENA